MNAPAIPSWFDNATHFFYGTPAGGSETAELWDEFLQSESAAPYVVVDPTTQQRSLRPGLTVDEEKEVQALYLSFLSSELQKVYQSESMNALSTNEIEQRKLVFTIFDILMTMLKSALTSQMAVGGSMDFLTRKQKEYGELRSRVFFYEGLGTISKNITYGETWPSTADWNSTEVTYSTDPAKYNLGYGNITLSEISDWCAANVDNTTATTTAPITSFNPQPGVTPMFTVETTPFDTDYYKSNGDVDGQTDVNLLMKIYLQRNSDKTVTVRAAVGYSSSDDDISSRTLGFSLSGYSSTITTTDGNASTIQQAVENAYYAAYNQATAAGVPFNDHPLMIPYQPGILASAISDGAGDDKMKARLQNYMSKRGSLNQSLSTYVDSLKSKMDLYGDKRDQAKQLLDSSIQMRKSTSDIITACIQQMSNIISSTFR